MDKTVHTFEHNDGPVSHVPVNICLLYHGSLCNIRWGKSARNRAGRAGWAEWLRWPGGIAEMVSGDGRAGGQDNPDGISSVGNGTVYN